MLLPQKLSMRSDACDQFPREFHIYIIFNLWPHESTGSDAFVIVWHINLNPNQSCINMFLKVWGSCKKKAVVAESFEELLKKGM